MLHNLIQPNRITLQFNGYNKILETRKNIIYKTGLKVLQHIGLCDAWRMWVRLMHAQ